MDKLISDFSIGLFFWQVIVFVALLFLLRKYAWNPILNAVNERESKISDSLSAAEEAERKMQELTASNEALLKEARMERDAMLKEARETKQDIVNEAKDSAKEEAAKIIAAAKETIKTEKQAALAELKNQVAALSIDIAEKVVKERLSGDEKQKELISGLVEEVTLN